MSTPGCYHFQSFVSVSKFGNSKKDQNNYLDGSLSISYSKYYQNEKEQRMLKRPELNKAIRYIEAGLKSKLILEDISEQANMSAWHFHRVFLASTGITVGEYIRRRRISEAAKELVFTHKPIKVLAGEYQYESQAAFTRSFTSIYGVSPGKLRRMLGPLKFFHALPHPRKGENMLTPRFEHKKQFRVVGITCENTMKNNNIPKLWNEFNQGICPMMDRNSSKAALGISYYTDMAELNEDTPFTYLAGFEIQPEAECPQGLTERTVPEADYAVFQHIGSLDTLNDTYNAIYGEWLPQSGYRHKVADVFELYDERFHYGMDDSVMEIWVPIEKN
jgi:AraC family transcriptional regulator